ncbi:DUF3618 domain-containing protein [Streptomyces sp. NPDC054842]
MTNDKTGADAAKAAGAQVPGVQPGADTSGATAGAKPGSDAPESVGAKGPEELRRQIEETRSRLGDTVEELAAKADVKARARARAADLKDRAGAMTVQMKGTAGQAGQVVQTKAAHAGQVVQGKAAQCGHVVQENMPEPVRNAASTVVQAGRRHPGPVLIGAGVILAVSLMLRRHNGHR